MPASTGLLSRRTKTILIAIAGALLAVMGVLRVLDHQGAFTPRLSLDGFGWNGEYVAPRRVDHLRLTWQPTLSAGALPVPAANNGPNSLTISDIRVNGAGFTFLRAVVGDIHPTATGFATGGRTLSAADPYVLGPGERGDFGVDIHITDCHAVGEPDLAVTVSSWAGTRTVDFGQPQVVETYGGWTAVAGQDLSGIGGLRYLADQVCRGER